MWATLGGRGSTQYKTLCPLGWSTTTHCLSLEKNYTIVSSPLLRILIPNTIMLTQIIVLLMAVAMSRAGGNYGYSPSYGYKGYPHIAYSQPEVAYDAYAKPQPYSFGYETKDAYGNKQFRQEDSDASGAKRGSYGYTDSHGIYRTVEYVADKNGFRAWIKTNEPGTANQNPADVEVNAVESPVVHHAPAYSSPAVYSAPVDHYDVEPRPIYKSPAYHSYGSSPKVYKVPSYGYKPHYRKYDDVY